MYVSSRLLEDNLSNVEKLHLRRFVVFSILCLLTLEPTLAAEPSAQTATLVGDFNHDHKVDHDDLRILTKAFGQRSTGKHFDLALDLNGDGAIDISDVAFLKDRWTDKTPMSVYLVGDVKRDGRVNSSNANQPATVWGTSIRKSSFSPSVNVNHSSTINNSAAGAINAQMQSKGIDSITSILSGAGAVQEDAVPTPPPQATVMASAEPRLATPLVAAVPGDVNGDGLVDISDTQKLSASWGLTSNDPGFNPEADLNHDGIINGQDLTALASLMAKVDLNSVASVRDGLIKAGYFSAEQYADFVGALVFGEVFQRLKIDALGKLLIEKGFIRSDIPDVATLYARLGQKGIDPVEWKLRPYGFLSAIGD